MIFLRQIQSAFQKFSYRNAICIQDVFYTYDDLAIKIATIHHKIEADYGTEQRVGIIVSNDIETYAAILAVLLSGKTYIPIHPSYPTARVAQIIEQSEIKLILSKAAIFQLNVSIIITADLQPAIDTTINIPVTPVANNDAYILFTSGSTGTPKGVPISYYNLNSFVNAFYALGYKVDENDRFLQMFDLTFDLSVMSYLIPLCLGACVYTIPDTGMKYTGVYQVLESHNITFALMVPSILSYLRPYFPEINLPSLKYSLFCGEALHKDVVTEWITCASHATIDNVYGPTEATIFCMAYKINRHPDIPGYNGIVTIGKPMQGMEAIVVDENLQLLNDGEKGELCLHGNQLTAGYLNPEKNKESFFELSGKKYYRTGDIVYKNEAGNFMYCGRADHQVKIQGYRVELSEIEFQLRQATGNANVAALDISAANGLYHIEAVLEGDKIDIGAIIDSLKTKLPAYMIPSHVHFIAAFPLNANGKTDRNALKKIITTIV